MYVKKTRERRKMIKIGNNLFIYVWSQCSFREKKRRERESEREREREIEKEIEKDKRLFYFVRYLCKYLIP